MNCKPGDLAIVVGDSEYVGMLVEILYLAPAQKFPLPDGYPHVGCADGYWVLKILGQKRYTSTVGGGRRLVQYGTGRDLKLRPLPGENMHQETEREIAA